VVREVRAFVHRHGESTPLDPLLRAKRELDRHFDKPLYMRDIAGIAEQHSATFGRKFASRFGVTPVRYRTILRLNQAALLTWSRPDLSITEIAQTVGFDDLPYFHREFLRHFKKTPAVYGRRGESSF
jgi:AraC-like DNA-binding protein